MSAAVDAEKRLVAEAAAQLVEDGMRLGLGTGSTVAHLLPALARRELRGLRCVATSAATELQARQLGLPVEPFADLARLDLAIDGADQVARDGWLVKGGGGAHTREKVVAAAAAWFVVIADSSKEVERVHAPVPVELLDYGTGATLAALALAALRADTPPSPDGGLIADHHGPVDDPGTLAAWLSATPGVIDHGLFPPDLVGEVLVARDGTIERRRPPG